MYQIFLRLRDSSGFQDQCKQDQTLLWTCVAGAYLQRVNSRYAKFKYTGMLSDYIQITQCNLQYVT